MKRFIAIFACLISLSACQTTDIFTKENIGTGLGAVIGGVAGNQFGKGRGNTAMTIAGTLAGAMMGRSVGQSLDRADQLAAQQTTQSALESNRTGSTQSWSNPDTGNYGSTTPTHTYKQNGADCREYSQEVVIDGNRETVIGKACRGDDGKWHVANNNTVRPSYSRHYTNEYSGGELGGQASVYKYR